MTDVVLYTAIFGGRDSFSAPPEIPYDLRVFTDDRVLAERESRAIYTPLLVPGDPVRSARLVKSMPQLFLPGRKTWIWYDSSMSVRSDADLPGMLKASGRLGVPRHTDRNCIYDEAKICAELGLDDEDVISAQMQRYRDTYKHPVGDGLAETCILVRENDPEILKFNALWWKEISLHSKRDQLSFNAVARKLGLPIAYLENRRENPWFVQVGHRR